ncbi:LOW QUALITY PROTEIN: SRF1 Regulator of phospholipase D SRF1 [Candida maltosa Xu316]
MNEKENIPDSRQGTTRNRATTTSSSSDRHHSSPTAESIDIPLNPFADVVISSYSHKANVIPPYVLDTISKAYHKENLQHTSTNISDQMTTKTLAGDSETEKHQSIYNGMTQDPYIRSIDGSWWRFMQSIRHQTAYTNDQLRYDPEILQEYDLNGSWGGDERLKKEFANSISGGGVIQDVARGRFFGLFTKKIGGENDTRVRSTAGYWMGENRSQLKPNLKKIFLFNPLVPLLLRMLIIVFCAIALALAGSIFIFSKSKYDGHSVEQQPSTIMALVVESCALVYVIYIAYDEYTGKPLGLREPMSKMRLILLDLLFIIFSAANLSLAFNTMNDDEWVCRVNNTPGLAEIGLVFPTISSICRRQRALASFLFMVLVLWVLTFTVSLLRVIDRVNTPGPRNV